MGIKTPKQIARSQRNEAIKKEYEKEMTEPYVPGKNQAGSSTVIWNLSKKYKLTTAAIYGALKS